MKVAPPAKVTITLGIAVAAYVTLVRPWYRHWGATDAEATSALPGDDLVPDAGYQTTRALTIQAPPGAVWPWLVQMGQGRAGFYSYDWLEKLVGAAIQNVDRIVPELQNLAVGDVVPLSPAGGPTVARIEPDRALVLHDTLDLRTGRSLPPGSPRRYTVHWTWAFVLQPAGGTATRLLLRMRASFVPRRQVAPLVATVFDPAVFVMERGMLRGIQRHAERTAVHSTIGPCREIAPGVYCLEAGKGIMRSNVYFVRSGSSWVLIDAASANCERSIQQTAESLFGEKTRPAAILLTHYHPDHVGSAPELARLWDCPVYLHPDEMPLVSGDLATFRQYANPMDRWVVLPLLRVLPQRRVESVPAKPSLKDVAQAFDPAAALPGLPDWECIPTPGHTPGHASFFRSSDRVLIASDAVSTVDLNSFRGFLLWGLRRAKQRVAGPPWYSTWNWRAAKKSVAALAMLEPRVLACGHGMPMTGERTARELRAFADHFSGPAAERR